MLFDHLYPYLKSVIMSVISLIMLYYAKDIKGKIEIRYMI